MSNKIFVIENKEYNSTIYNDNIFIGNYYERCFLNFFKQNIDDNIMSIEDRFSHFDFIYKSKNKLNLIELKSRLNTIDFHQYSIIDCLKLDGIFKSKDEYLKKGKREVNIIFIFNFVDVSIRDENGSYKPDYYYYIVDLDFLKNECFIEKIFSKDCYLLPIKYLKKLDEDILNLLI